MAFWEAEPMSDQLENRPKFMEPHDEPLSWVVAYTRCRPLYSAVVKSLSEAHPDRGGASAPVDAPRYDDGGGHEPVGGGVVEPPTRTSCHCWLLPFQSAYCTMFPPSAVDAP